MAWYEKGKAPEWRALVERPYLLDALLAARDLLLQELPRAEELQAFLRLHRDAIIADCLPLVLRPPPEGSSYERRYAQPTRAIELISSEAFLSAICSGREQVRRLVEAALENFLAVDPHQDNINLYHAYFERLLRALVTNRSVDKLDLAAALQEAQARSGFIEKLSRHSHKLAVCWVLEIMLSLDLMEPLVTLTLEFKQTILAHVFAVLKGYATAQSEPERAENCLQVLKTFFERGLNFLAARRSEPGSPLTALKVETFFGVYSLFQANFSLLPAIVTSSGESCIKILALQLLQLNQILLSQPEARAREMAAEWAVSQCQPLISCMLGSRAGVAHPAFIDWLSISFAEAGQHEWQVELLRRLRVLEGVTGMMLAHRGNNILTAKIFQFLKLVFHSAAELEVLGRIERHRADPAAPLAFPLLLAFLDCLPALEAAVRQFRSINEPLFVTLFSLFKVVAQYCRNIDSVFSLYTQLEGCQAGRAAVARVLEFQQKEQCFMVFEREIGKDLGQFYSDDMFAHQKPVEFTVKPLPTPLQSNALQMASPFEAQAMIKIPPPSVSPALPPLPLPSLTPPPTPAPEKQEAEVVHLSKSETTIPQSEPKESAIITLPHSQNEQDTESVKTPSKYGSFMRERLREVETNIEARKSKSRTPTKIKNELKKAKNKWVANGDEQEEPENAFSHSRERTKPLSEPKLTNAFAECQLEKIAILRIAKRRLPAERRERALTMQRDARLLGWLAALRA